MDILRFLRTPKTSPGIPLTSVAALLVYCFQAKVGKFRLNGKVPEAVGTERGASRQLPSEPPAVQRGVCCVLAHFPGPAPGPAPKLEAQPKDPLPIPTDL